MLLVPPNLRISWSHGLDVADTPSHGQQMYQSNIRSLHDHRLTYQNPSFQGATSNLHYPSYHQTTSDRQQTPCGGGNSPSLQEAVSQETHPLLRAVYIDDGDKDSPLLMILESVNDAPHIMITAMSVETLNTIHQRLLTQHIDNTLLHHEQHQGEQLESLRGLRDGDVKILLTTVSIARGIDLPKNSIKIHYDIPLEREDYRKMAKSNHRIVMLLTNSDVDAAVALVKAFQKDNLHVPASLNQIICDMNDAMILTTNNGGFSSEEEDVDGEGPGVGGGVDELVVLEDGVKHVDLEDSDSVN